MAHIIIEAEKSHNLPSVSWRARKTSGVIQSESKDLRTREADADGVSTSPRSGEDEMSCPSSSIEEGVGGRHVCVGMKYSFLFHPHWGRPSTLLSSG